MSEATIATPVAVVIPTIAIDPLLERCVAECRRTGPDATIVVLADDATGRERLAPGVVVVETGPESIGAKRNRGVALTDAPYVAFIDSDAYPDDGWMQHAARLLDADEGLGAVGGPNVSPPNESRSERYVGYANRSVLVAGWWAFRKLRTAPARDVVALPSCNLIVRRSDYVALDGMRADLFTAEDTDFCTRLVRAGRRIHFSPDVTVFHKNRRLGAFVVQRYTFGVAMVPLLAEAEQPDAAYTAVSYAVAAFAVFVAGGPVALLVRPARRIWAAVMAVYATVLLAESVRQAARPDEVPGTMAALAVGNLAPGVGFVTKALGVAPELGGRYRNDR